MPNTLSAEQLDKLDHQSLEYYEHMRAALDTAFQIYRRTNDQRSLIAAAIMAYDVHGHQHACIKTEPDLSETTLDGWGTMMTELNGHESLLGEHETRKEGETHAFNALIAQLLIVESQFRTGTPEIDFEPVRTALVELTHQIRTATPKTLAGDRDSINAELSTPDCMDPHSLVNLLNGVTTIRGAAC